MAPEPHLPVPGHPQERSAADQAAAAGPAEERKTMAGPRRSSRQPRPPGLLDAGPLEPDIASFRLHLAAEGKSARTVRGYTSAVRWFAAGYLLSQAGKTSWEQADARDIQQWMVHLLDRYSSAYASIQFRALRQFFKWRAAEERVPRPDDPAPGTQGRRDGGPGIHQRRTIGTAEGLPGPVVRRAPRRRDHRGVHRDRHPPVRAGRDPLPPRRPRPQRPGPARPPDPDPRQGRDGPDRQDRPPGGPQPRPLPAGPRPAPAGLAAAAVARREQPGAADRDRHLPGRRPPRPAMPG